MVKVKQQLVSDSIFKAKSYGYGNPVKYITVHQTGNTGKGADAQAHANIQSNVNPRNASWHYQVDDSMAIQSFPDGVKCWAAGDGNGPGNTESLHIELCINSDGDYKQTISNGAKLVKDLLDKHNLDISRVKQHNIWSGKNCPAQIRAGWHGIDWNDFINLVQGINVYDRDEQVKATTVSSSVAGKRVESIYKGEEGLNFYASPEDYLKKPVGTFGYGEGWTIRKKMKVGSNEIYEVENSAGKVYYITAWHEYVKVVGDPAPQPAPEDTKKYRLRTGLFDDADRFDKAMNQMEEMFPGWLLYEFANKEGYEPRYRIITGTITGKANAERYAEKVRKELGWIVTVIEA